MHVYSSRADWQEEVEWRLAIAPIQSLEDLALNEWANPWMNPKIWTPGHVLLHNDNWPHPVFLSWFSSCFRVSWSRALSLAWTLSITCPALGCKMTSVKEGQIAQQSSTLCWRTNWKWASKRQAKQTTVLRLLWPLEGGSCLSIHSIFMVQTSHMIMEPVIIAAREHQIYLKGNRNLGSRRRAHLSLLGKVHVFG